VVGKRELEDGWRGHRTAMVEVIDCLDCYRYRELQRLVLSEFDVMTCSRNHCLVPAVVHAKTHFFWGGDNKQLRVQPPASAINVTLLAVAAERRAAASLLVVARRPPPVDRSPPHWRRQLWGTGAGA